MNTSDFHWQLSAIADAANGTLTGDDIPVTGINTDTRHIEKGQLFIALSGEHFDGHEFVAQAVRDGAVAVVVSRKIDCACPVIQVENTRTAFGLIARAWRRQFAIPLIAVTGSNGKTTVKEMLHAILSVQGMNLATQGNLNNDIGVPMTLLRLRAEHRSAVIEMGANHPGEIAWLTKIAEPSVALVNNAGAAHLEGFGSIEGVAHAKGEIYGGLGDSGTAIINADDHYAQVWRDLCENRKTLSFALRNEADIKADWQPVDNGSLIRLFTPEGETDIQLNLPGRHNVMNALAASTAALAAGIGLPQIRQGLMNVQSVAGRLQIKPGLAGSRIIDDTYNANPDSLRVALQVMRKFQGRHLLALGDMGELGDDSEALHREAGLAARSAGVDRLFTVGQLAKLAAGSFGQASYSYKDQPSMISALKDELDANVTVLVKGSRLAHMEKVVQALTIDSGGQ